MIGFTVPPVIITAVIEVPSLTWCHAIGLLGGVGFVYAAVITTLFARTLDSELTGSNITQSLGSSDVTERIRVEIRSLVA